MRKMLRCHEQEFAQSELNAYQKSLNSFNKLIYPYDLYQFKFYGMAFDR